MSDEVPTAVVVVGPEGSGTSVLWRCLCEHPELGHLRNVYAPDPPHRAIETRTLLHLSLPTLRPMVWLGPEDLPPGAKVVLIERSPLHTVFSAYRRFYDDPADAWSTYLRARDSVEDFVRRSDAVVVSYEELVTRPLAVLGRIWRHLGIGTGPTPSFELSNRNDDRWGGDGEFARFHETTFDSPAPRGSGVGVDVYSLGGTRTLVVDAGGAGVGDGLRARLADARVAGGGPYDVRMVVEPRATGPTGNPPGLRVIVDGDVRFTSSSPGPVVEWIEASLAGPPTLRGRPGLVRLEAAAVMWRSGVIVVSRVDAVGTTRLTDAFVRLGATLLAERAVTLDTAGTVVDGDRMDHHVSDEGFPVSAVVRTTWEPTAVWKPRIVRGVRVSNLVLPLVRRPDPAAAIRVAAAVAGHAIGIEGARPDADAVADAILSTLGDGHRRVGPTELV